MRITIYPKRSFQNELRYLEGRIGEYCVDTGYHPEYMREEYTLIPPLKGKTLYQAAIAISNILWLMDINDKEKVMSVKEDEKYDFMVGGTYWRFIE